MKKIHLHIGAHKSASTTVQRNLRRNANKLSEELNTAFLGGTELTHTAFGVHFRKLATGKLHIEDIADYESSIAEVKECINSLVGRISEDTIIISDEAMLGHSSLDKYKGIYTHIETVADSLKKIFIGYETDITFIVRRQDDFIESCYLQQIKETRSISFDEFLTPINIAKLSWLDICSSLECHFKCKVNVIPFESIKQLGAKGFVELFLTIVHSKPIRISGFELIEKANPSFSELGVDVSRNLLPKLSKDAARKINSILFMDLSSDKYGKASFLNQFYRTLMINKCSKDNEVLFKKYILNSKFIPKDVIESVSNYWFDK